MGNYNVTSCDSVESKDNYKAYSLDDYILHLGDIPSNVLDLSFNITLSCASTSNAKIIVCVPNFLISDCSNYNSPDNFVCKWWEMNVIANIDYVIPYDTPITHSITIPSSFAGVAKANGIYIRHYINNSDISVKSVTNNMSVSIKSYAPNPTIENLANIGEYYEKPITINWRSQYQEGYEYELYYNNVRIKNGTGATENEFVIPSNTFTGTLPSSVRVRTFNVLGDGTKNYSQWAEKSINLKEITPTIQNVSLSGSNIDKAKTVSWDSTDQERYILEVWQGDIKKHEFTGTVAKSHTIPQNTLAVGLTVFKVKVAYKDRWTTYEQISTTLVETLPSIAILEPDGRIVDRDTPLRICWTSQNQSRYKLVVDGKEYTGTTQTEVLLSAGTLTSGRKLMTLTVYLDIAGKTKETTKSVEFVVQGKPPMPTITSGSNFATNRPTISFDSQDANAYRVAIEGIWDSGWCNGLAGAFKIGTYLVNGAYTLSVQVKNQFNIISDKATQRITINATVPQAITLKVYDEYALNRLKWDDTGFVCFYVYRNGLMIAKTYTGEFIDYTGQGECIYKVMGVTKTDTFNFSNEVFVNCTFDYPILSIGSDMLDLLYRQGKVDLTMQYNPMQTKEFYIGRSLPVTRHGEHNDFIYSFDYSEMREESYHKLLEMVKAKKPMLYRSNKRKIWLTIDNLGITDDKIVDYSINAYEIDMNEVIDFD